MNLKNFTIKAQEVIQQAAQIAVGKQHQAIEPGHLLMAVHQVDQSIIDFLIKKNGLNDYTNVLNSVIESYPNVAGGEPYLSRSSSEVLQKATDASKKHGDQFVS